MNIWYSTQFTLRYGVFKNNIRENICYVSQRWQQIGIMAQKVQCLKKYKPNLCVGVFSYIHVEYNDTLSFIYISHV